MPLKLGPLMSHPVASHGSTRTPPGFNDSAVVEASASSRARVRYSWSPVACESATSPPSTTPWLYVQVSAPLLVQVRGSSPSLISRSSLIIPEETNHSHTDNARLT